METVYQVKHKTLTDGDDSVYMAESSLKMYCEVLNIDYDNLLKKEVIFEKKESEFYQ